VIGKFVSEIKKGNKQAMKTALQKVEEMLGGDLYEEFCKYLLKCKN
jgi:hypothetical protein